MNRRLPGSRWLIAAAALAASACEAEPDDFVAVGDATYLLPGGGEQALYRVDSVVYDPAADGIARLASSSTWSLDLEGHETGDPYTVRVSAADGGGGITSALFWSWDTLATPPRSLNVLAGVPLIGLKVPFSTATRWDPLVFADRDLTLLVASEPLAVFKDWTNARVERVGPYNLPDGSTTNAVWVTLAQAENLLELREWREVYGAGYGLLERHVRILDTQNTDAGLSWEEKAERGFTVDMVRLN